MVIDQTSLPVQWCGLAVASQSRPLLKSLRSPQTAPHREQDPGSGPSLTHCCSLLWQDKPETILLLRKKLLMQHHTTKNPQNTNLFTKVCSCFLRFKHQRPIQSLVIIKCAVATGLDLNVRETVRKSTENKRVV